MSEFDQYRDREGGYIVDGVSFLEPIDVICHFAGFCGCGAPEEAAEHVLRGLGLIEDLRTTWDAPDKSAAYLSWQDRERAIFGNRGAAYFFYYWADSRGLTEHGGSVPGWLTAKGLQLRAMIKEALPEED